MGGEVGLSYCSYCSFLNIYYSSAKNRFLVIRITFFYAKIKLVLDMFEFSSENFIFGPMGPRGPCDNLMDGCKDRQLIGLLVGPSWGCHLRSQARGCQLAI